MLQMRLIDLYQSLTNQITSFKARQSFDKIQAAWIHWPILMIATTLSIGKNVKYVITVWLNGSGWCKNYKCSLCSLNLLLLYLNIGDRSSQQLSFLIATEVWFILYSLYNWTKLTKQSCMSFHWLYHWNGGKDFTNFLKQKLTILPLSWLTTLKSFISHLLPTRMFSTFSFAFYLKIEIHKYNTLLELEKFYIYHAGIFHTPHSGRWMYGVV